MSSSELFRDLKGLQDLLSQMRAVGDHFGDLGKDADPLSLQEAGDAIVHEEVRAFLEREREHYRGLGASLESAANLLERTIQTYTTLEDGLSGWGGTLRKTPR